MNLERRISRLEQARGGTGKFHVMCALDEADRDARIAKMRDSGELGPDDTVIVTMWGISEDDRDQGIHGAEPCRF